MLAKSSARVFIVVLTQGALAAAGGAHNGDGLAGMDVQAMPHGFETYVGERGTLLSGGQKQRVAIARIFLMDPAILILDEATSALDSVTEAKIQRAFDRLSQGRTTLIIAHRLSTIRGAGRIVSISDGVITEVGTHRELLQKGGVYADLYNTQNASALEGLK